jgi:hypothetical protein
VKQKNIDALHYYGDYNIFRLVNAWNIADVAELIVG